MKNLFIGILVIFLTKACNSSKSKAKEATNTNDIHLNTSVESQVQVQEGFYKVMQLQTKNLKQNQPTLRVLPSENSVSGNSGCNSYSVSFTKNGDTYDFGYPMATKIYCEGDTENNFFTALRNITTISQTKERLIAKDKGGNTLFEAVAIEE